MSYIDAGFYLAKFVIIMVDFVFDVVGLGVFYFFFQAEDGIRDYKVTGVQTCALPISSARWRSSTAPSARPRDRDERARGVGDRVGRALGAVEDRHLAEAGARFENGQ